MSFLLKLNKRKICHKELTRILHYNPITGIWIWIAPRHGKIKVNSIAGNSNSDGYLVIELGNIHYLLHRLAWFYMTGKWPKDKIDHKNRKRKDNRWKNLREATHTQNMHNCSLQKNNTSGYTGVFFRSDRNKWRTQIRCNGKNIYLGLFDTAKEGHQAYKIASAEYHKEFNKFNQEEEDMAGSSWGQIQSGYDEKTKMGDVVELVDRSKLKKYKGFRPVGPVFNYRQVWLPIYKDGKAVIKPNGQPLQIPKIITNYDPEKQAYTSEKCPYQELMLKMNKHLDPKKNVYETTVFLSNVISRALQEDLPETIKPPTKEETKSGFRSIDSKHRNPVQVLNIQSSNEFKKIKDTMELNTVKLKSGEKVVKEPSDPKYGYDLLIKFDAEAKVKSDKFMVQKGERTPLTEEETEYLLWDIQGAIDEQIDTEAAAQKEADRLWVEFKKSISKSKSEDEDEDGPEDLEDDDDKPKKKKKKPAFEEDEDEEEEKPKKKKKILKKDDDEDEEEEEKPKKKKKPVEEDEDEEETPKKKKKKFIDEEEEEEKPKKKKKKPAEEDEDEEEEKPKSKKKKPKDEEEDEDEEILGLDDDDEDEE